MFSLWFATQWVRLEDLTSPPSAFQLWKKYCFIYSKKPSADISNIWYWDSQKPTLHQRLEHSYWLAVHRAVQSRASHMQALPWQEASSLLMQVFGSLAREVWLRFYCG